MSKNILLNFKRKQVNIPQVYTHYIICVVITAGCIIAFSLLSCKNSNEVAKNISLMQSRNIILPIDSMKSVFAGQTTDQQTPKWKLVAFYDMFDCTECSIKKFDAMWSPMLNLEQESDDQLQFIFVFSPQRQNSRQVEESLQKIQFNHVIYLDTTGLFLQNNPHIPNLEVYHTFLTNEHDSVVLVGNPAQNEQIRQIMLDIIGIKTI